MRLLYVICFFFYSLFLFNQSNLNASSTSNILGEFDMVNISDGVSEGEAISIVQEYLKQKKNYDIRSAKVIATTDSYWSQDSWHVSVKTKFWFRVKSGLKWVVVNVHKKTGQISDGGAGPS